MIVEGQTNVTSLRMGSGSVDGIGKELGRFVVATMEIPWNLAKDRLGAPPRHVAFCTSMEVDAIDRQLAELPECDAIVAIGGGQAIDLGKYFAWRKGVRLVTIPTILSVDAFVTPAAAVRRSHEVDYVGAASADPLVIDFDLLRTAPNDLNVAGVGDLLSIHTACWDWELAQARGHSEYPFSADDVAKARANLRTILERADDIRQCNDRGLEAIVEGYLRINTVCLPAGHYRTEEGSEHYLFYELEERLRRGFVHGHIVGLGVYLMSRLQENDPGGVDDFLRRVQLRHNPIDMEIRRDDLVASLLNLREFVQSRPKLWYTVINDRPITPAWVNDALKDLRFE